MLVTSEYRFGTIRAAFLFPQALTGGRGEAAQDCLPASCSASSGKGSLGIGHASPRAAHRLRADGQIAPWCSALAAHCGRDRRRPRRRRPQPGRVDHRPARLGLRRLENLSRLVLRRRFGLVHGTPRPGPRISRPPPAGRRGAARCSRCGAVAVLPSPGCAGCADVTNQPPPEPPSPQAARGRGAGAVVAAVEPCLPTSRPKLDRSSPRASSEIPTTPPGPEVAAPPAAAVGRPNAAARPARRPIGPSQTSIGPRRPAEARLKVGR